MTDPSRRQDLSDVREDRVELAVHPALLEEPAAEPGHQCTRGPHVPHRHRGRFGRRIEPEERLPAVPLTALHPAESGGRREVYDLEFGRALTEPYFEPYALPERLVALRSGTSREPLGLTTRVCGRREA